MDPADVRLLNQTVVPAGTQSLVPVMADLPSDGIVLMEAKTDENLLAPSVINVMTADNKEVLMKGKCSQKTIKRFCKKSDRQYGTYLVYNTTD